MKREPSSGRRPSGRPLRINPAVLIRNLLSLIWRIFATFFLVCVITGCIVGAILTVYVLNYVAKDTTDIDLNKLETNSTLLLYAQNQETGEYYEMQRIYGDVNTIWISADKMPDHLFDVTIAAEDKRFWAHHGVDWKRTAGSFVNMFIPIYQGTSGGSTITQQVVKNVTGEAQVRVDRKIKEIFTALNLENKYSKEQILEAYLNIAPFGGNIQGIQAAANYYFNKDAIDLTIPECAAIVATTQAPTGNSPIKNPENNKARRNYIFKTMLEMGTISEAEYEQYCNTDITIDLNETIASKSNTYQSWFVDHVLEEVIEDLMAKYGYTKQNASNILFSSGYRVYTTVDEEMQAFLEQTITNPDVLPPVYNEEYPEAAFVILDPHGKVLALAGSDREKTGSRLFNRATQALRHPGSSIKPISAYLQAFEMNLVTWSSMIEDEPIIVMDGTEEREWPVNYYGEYRGKMSIVEAIKISCNTIPAKLVDFVTPQRCYDTLKNKLGVESLVPQDVAPSPMTLGGMTYGMKLIELAGAYQIYANGGTFTRPYSYTRVLDANNNVILEQNTTPIRVISEETSVIINRLLQRVVNEAGGTGTAARLSNVPTGGKTGTSTDDNDQLFVGITPYYVAACWMGYDEKQSIRYANYPPPRLWKSIMEPLHEGLSGTSFPESENVEEHTYCLETGYLASDYCHQTATGYYKKTNLPPVCTECEFGPSVSYDDSDDDDDED